MEGTMITVEEMKAEWDWDWKEVMAYADFNEDQIESVIASYEGSNDESDWKLVAKLKDGRYGAVKAGCDYTGWG
jgi:hypothetical protein